MKQLLNLFIMNSPCEVVSFCILEIVKALIKSRDLFLSYVGFLLSMDTFKRRIMMTS